MKNGRLPIGSCFGINLILNRLNNIRRATQGGLVLGSERFAQEVSVLTGCNTRRGKAGRPFKQTGEPMRDAILQNKQ